MLVLRVLHSFASTHGNRKPSKTHFQPSQSQNKPYCYPGYYLELQSLDVGKMILILTNQAVFVTLSVVTIPPLAQCIFILTLNQADVIGDHSDVVTQNAWFRWALCAAISGDISILIQTGAESWGRFPVPRICRWESSNYRAPFRCQHFETSVTSSQIQDDNKQFAIDQGYNNISHQTDTFIWHNPL